MSELIAALDIGTSKVVALVAELDAEQKINVIGFGEQPSLGLRKGMVVDIDATTNTVAAAVREAAAMANCKISNVYVGIAGAHIRSLNSSGMVAMKDSEVTEADMERVIETAKAIAIPNDQVVLHTLPQEYIIDGQEGVRRPLGMSGRRLEVKVHIVTGAVSAAENIEKCVRRCGLNVQELVLQPLASAAACLTRDEMEIGVGLVDIGGGTTDFALFTGGAIRSFSRSLSPESSFGAPPSWGFDFSPSPLPPNAFSRSLESSAGALLPASLPGSSAGSPYSDGGMTISMLVSTLSCL